jgi:hypothetical protein
LQTNQCTSKYNIAGHIASGKKEEGRRKKEEEKGRGKKKEGRISQNQPESARISQKKEVR